MTCPRCRWPVAILDLCPGCRAEDQARLRGETVTLMGSSRPPDVRQMGREQVVMAIHVRGTR